MRAYTSKDGYILGKATYTKPNCECCCSHSTWWNTMRMEFTCRRYKRKKRKRQPATPVLFPDNIYSTIFRLTFFNCESVSQKTCSSNPYGFVPPFQARSWTHFWLGGRSAVVFQVLSSRTAHPFAYPLQVPSLHSSVSFLKATYPPPHRTAESKSKALGRLQIGKL